jgi:hypothetical protein
MEGKDDEKNSGNNPPATVTFFNGSSFKVDIYKNLNPESFDPTTLVCNVNAGSTKQITLYASTDQKTGDTFYPRYKALLANSLETGTSDIYIDAERNLSNITFVVEKGQSYTKTIPQPQPGQLKFINGYICVQNIGTTQVQIIKGSEVLYKMDDRGAYLNSGSNLGYYEIPFSFFDDTLTIDQLKAFSDSFINFSSFGMERGKLYRFTINGNIITGPNISNIDPMR